MSKLLLVDGHSIMNRAFYGVPELTNHEGLHTNAVYGFLNIVFKVVDEERPDFFAVAFDRKEPTFRHEMYKEYKGTRKPMPAELHEQIPMMKEMLTAMGIRIIEQPGLEADDIIGTLSLMAQEQGYAVTVLSGDRDLLQLASDTTLIRVPKTKAGGTVMEDYYAKDVVEAYGLTPAQFMEAKALQGDSSDNIPGLPGVGEKTAAALIAQYDTVEGVIEHKDEVKPPKAQKALLENIELLRLCRKLVEINRHGELGITLDDLKYADPFTPAAYELCQRYELKSILSRFSEPQTKDTLPEHFWLIDDSEAQKEKIDSLPRNFAFSLYEDGVSIYVGGPLDGKAEENAFFLPWNNDFDKYLMLSSLESKIAAADFAATLSLKNAIKQIAIKEGDCADVAILAYILDPTRSGYTAADLAMTYENIYMPQAKETDRYIMACYEAAIAGRIAHKLIDELKEQGTYSVYEAIDLPLVYVLDEMEKNGIALNKSELNKYGENLMGRITELEQIIYEGAGEKFNINSPKQLGEILFEKMGMPGGKKTKSGYSTAADVLEKLAVEYPIVKDILEYRQLSKLKSTYADGLAGFIGDDGRIHCHFQQTVTATGRLSCTDPNLQNIPIRMELGRQIRKLFYPKDGYVFIDADYSQIELRILAHLSGDATLIEAFNSGDDIHRVTASKVFHVPFEEVTDLQRRSAKVVNFGIIYGMSAFGLSEDLSISRKEAAEFTEKYFETYPGIKGYLDGLVEYARANGYVKSLYGRRRPVPDINNTNFMKRSFAERVAMNSPIQGTAADIMKLAMIKVYRRLKAELPDARILVQVHDELLLEVPKEQEEMASKLLADEMMSAAQLLVPLDVDVHSGATWYEAK